MLASVRARLQRGRVTVAGGRGGGGDAGGPEPAEREGEEDGATHLPLGIAGVVPTRRPVGLGGAARSPATGLEALRDPGSQLSLPQLKSSKKAALRKGPQTVSSRLTLTSPLAPPNDAAWPTRSTKGMVFLIVAASSVRRELYQSP